MADHTLFKNFDPVAGTYTYSYYDTPVNSPKYLKTVGSSTTVSELNATDDTFLGFLVGDLIHVRVDGTVTTRRVTAIGSVPDSVTVNTAVNWENGGAGRAFSYQRIHSGTTASDGWFYCGSVEDKSVAIVVTTLGATSIELTIEGEINGVPFTLYNHPSITVSGNAHIPIAENVERLRIGVKATGAGTDDVTVVFRGKPKEARP